MRLAFALVLLAGSAIAAPKWQQAADPESGVHAVLRAGAEGHGTEYLSTSRDGRWLVSGNDHGDVVVWDLRTLAQRTLLTGADTQSTADMPSVQAAAWFGGNDTIIVAVARTRTADKAPGELIEFDPATGKQLRTRKVAFDVERWLRGAGYRFRRFVFGAPFENWLRTGREPTVGEGDLAYTRKGDAIVTWTGKAVELRRGKTVRTLADVEPFKCAFADDASLVACSPPQGKSWVARARDGKRVELASGDAPIAISASHDLVATRERDYVIVWRASTGKQVVELKRLLPPSALAFGTGADGRALLAVATMNSGEIRLYRLP